MQKRSLLKRFMVPAVLLLTAVLAAAAVNSLDKQYTPLDKEFYLTEAQLTMFQPGLNIEVDRWDIAADGTVTVDFTVTDDGGLGLDLSGTRTPGSIRVSFLIGYIPGGSSTYLTYTTRDQTSPITGDTATQPTSDSSGTFTDLGDGKYRYTFGGKLPVDFDRDATHTIGFYAERDLEDYGLGAPMADGVVTFVPSGAPVETIRQVTTNEACMQCHDDVRLHGRRHSVELCILCHVPGVVDPDTGNSVDMPVMIHKIHMGEELPSVQAGTSYQIIGYRQSVHDYSTVAYPQDRRYCDTCHVEAAVQNEAHLLNPTRATCGACHDDVNFASGENHAGGPAISDNLCANCHIPQGEQEFDASILNAHIVPSESNQLVGVNISIQDVTHAGPGSAPTAFFTVTDNTGADIPLADLDRLRLLLAGPTDDYQLQVSENALDGAVVAGLTAAADGGAQTVFSYTFETLLPADAEGSFAVGAEGRIIALLNPGTVNEMTLRETAENPVAYFPVTDAVAAPRRTIVSDQACEQCHRNLELHGSNRHNASGYCQLCHNPVGDDSPFRAAEDMPARSISFQMMIHRIHMGEELTRDYTVVGYHGTPHNYNELRYPSARTNCTKCHEGNSWMTSTGVLSVKTEREYFSPMPPTTAACLGCHDTMAAAAHAFLNTAFFGTAPAEACMACHGPEREFSVGASHAR